MKESVKIEKERRAVIRTLNVVETEMVSVVITEAVVTGTVVIKENVVAEMMMMTTAEAVTVTMIGVEMTDAVVGLVLVPRIDLHRKGCILFFFLALVHSYMN